MTRRARRRTGWLESARSSRSLRPLLLSAKLTELYSPEPGGTQRTKLIH